MGMTGPVSFAGQLSPRTIACLRPLCCLNQPHPGGLAMSSDPLPLPKILAEPPDEADDADYEAIYAEVATTERGRRFLIEYTSRNPRAEAPADVTLTGHGAAVAPIIGRIEAAGVHAVEPAWLAVAERIQDIAFALRERDADASLCDALDAAVRDLSDAFTTAQRAGEQDERFAEEEAFEYAGPQSAQAGEPDGAEHLDAPVEAEATGAETAQLMSEDLRGKSDDAHADEGTALPRQIAVETDRAVESAAHGAASESTGRDDSTIAGDEAGSLHAPEQTDEVMSAPAVVAIESPELEVAGVEGAAAVVVRGPAANDPLAALRELSEEELIALFS